MRLCIQSGKLTKFGLPVRTPRKAQFLGRKIGDDFSSKIRTVVPSETPCFERYFPTPYVSPIWPGGLCLET